MHTWYSSENHRRLFKRFLASIPVYTESGETTPHFDALIRDILMGWHPTYHWREPMIDCATRWGIAGMGMEAEIEDARQWRRRREA